MQKIDLLPCPFCGETDLHLESSSGFGADVVICSGCLATFSQQEITCEEDLIKAWNTRSSGWIPCSERMPEFTEEGLGILNSDCLLVMSSSTGWMAMAYYLTDGEKSWWLFADAQNKVKIDWDEVTHWMPLPELPKGV